MSSPNVSLELDPERQAPGSQGERGFWAKLKRGLLMTHTEIAERIGAAVQGRAVIDRETLDYLEEALISADLGVETALELVEGLRRDAGPRGLVDLAGVKARLADRVAEILAAVTPPPAEESMGESAKPLVTLVVGVNGVGKTTSIAKLARRAQAEGHRVLIAAADTFRAAAIEQLALWGERLGVEVIRQSSGADPAAVVFDALRAARARGATRIFVDTAGRLHNKDHLMAELGKVRRVVDREASDWPQRTLLVLDATTGQNALSQAKRFQEVARVDGVLLAKVDGTAKGGIVVAIAKELKLPVLFLGVGETPDDLVEFRPREFATALLE